MAESNRLCVAGSEQGLTRLSLCEVVEIIIFEEPGLAVSDAGADQPLTRTCDDDTGGFPLANSVVGLPQDVAPRRRIAIQRGRGCYLPNHRFGGLGPSAHTAGSVGDGNHHTVGEFDHLDTILASVLVSNSD